MVCPPAETTVKITAHFIWQDYPGINLSKDFVVTVIADTDDASAVASAKEALTLGDTSAVKTNISLPNEGRKSTLISWTSSDTSVVRIEQNAGGETVGIITRDPGSNKTAVLTAKISRGDNSDTKAFSITVLKSLAVSVESISFKNDAGETVFTQPESGSVYKIIAQEEISPKSGNETLFTAVYSPDTDEESDTYYLSDFASYNIAQVSNGGTIDITPSLALTKDCIVKVFAFEDLNLIMPLMNVYSPESTVKKSAKLFVVGDSTASNYGDTQYPQTGWAQVLQNYFPSADIKVVNYALSGRSSLSFKKETNYTKLKNEISAGDYLIIQFGHNDSKNEADRYTDPAGDRFTSGSFKNSLMDYVNIALDKGAQPILATPITRRKNVESTHEAYVNAVRQLGDEVNIPVLDMYYKTRTYVDTVGLDKAMDLFLAVKPYDSRFIGYKNFSKSKYYKIDTNDATHLNIYGADMVAKWATEEMQRLGLPIAGKLNSYQPSELPSYADATSAN